MTKKLTSLLFAAGIIASTGAAWAQTTATAQEAAVTAGGAEVHTETSATLRETGSVKTRPATVQSTSVLASDEAIAHGTTGVSTINSDPGTGSGAGLEREVRVVPAAATSTTVTTETAPAYTVEKATTEETVTTVEE